MEAGIADWLADNPAIAQLQVALCDLNGVLRGKCLPRRGASKLDDGVRMPLSALGIDIWGEDVIGAGQVFETGDGDGVAEATGRGPLLQPWLATPTALLPVWMRAAADGSSADPRRALDAVLARYRARGWRPIVAFELEFYLFAGVEWPPAPPPGASGGALYALDALDAHAALFDDIYAGCEAMGIGADAAISENGAGQFEINLLHGEALRAADDALLFKRLVKGCARRHGLVASFMAKPWGERAGNGLHLHVSVLDTAGANVFDDGGEAGSATLRAAIGGCLAAASGDALLFAPHLNSYRRLQPGSHAPTAICWGHENRTAMVRVPGGAPAARRFEHRAGGADANPYLLLAAVLGAALDGIEAGADPGPPLAGDAYSAPLPQLPRNWDAAIEAFAATTRFDPLLQSMLLACKRQERAALAARLSAFEWHTYRDAV